MGLPDFLNFNRLKSIFNPQSMEMNNQPPMGDPMAGMNMNNPTPAFPGIPVESGLPMQQPDFDPVARMREIYQPQTQATDRFNELAQSYPVFAEPSKWRKFGAAALGSLTDLGTNFGGNRTGVKGTDVFNETTGKNKWMERVGSWKEQVGPAQQAANLERQENINSRTLAHNTVQSEIAQRKNESTAKNQDTMNRIRQQRADAYDYRVRNPNLKFDFNGPRVRILDPASGKITETSWESKDFTPQEKLELEQKNAIARIQETGAQARKTEETRQEGRTDITETREWKPYTEDMPDGTKRTFMYNEITGEQRERSIGNTPNAVPIRPNANTNRPQSEIDVKRGVENRATEFLARHPELSKFIKINKDGTVTIAPSRAASSFGGFETNPGFHPNIRAEAEKYIFREESAPKFPTSGQGGGRGGGSGRGMLQGPRFNDSNPPPAPQGFRYVRKPGGGWTAVPLGQ